MKVTKYNDVNHFLIEFLRRVKAIMGDELIGVYLYGSLTYGDFNYDSSDIDLMVIVKKLLSNEKIKAIKKLHFDLGKKYKKWADRHECSYTPLDFFKKIIPPKKPRPYFGSGIFYAKAQYGNEWLINNYLLYHYGVVLFGRDFKKLVKPIDIKEVKKACIRDLYKEWVPKIKEKAYFNDSHHQAYIVLNLCRILYTIKNNFIASKKVSAIWAKNKFKQWKNLIEQAESWKYGVNLNLQQEIVAFIKFVIVQIKNSKVRINFSTKIF